MTNHDRKASVASSNPHESNSTTHDRLGFHPECPTCRQDRLFGVLSPEPVFSRRFKALLATGVLAFTAGVTATSVAYEPDHQQEGGVLPEQGAPSSTDELGRDSGGDTVLPFELRSAPDSPQDSERESSEDSAPLEAEPLDDPDGRLSLTSPDSADPNEEAAPVPPTEVAPPVAPTPQAQLPLDPNGDSGVPGIAPPAARPDPAHHATKHRRNKDDRPTANRHRKTAPSQSAPPTQAPTADPIPQSTGEQAAGETPTTTVVAPLGDRHIHAVRPGESLWSIASRLLGADVSSGAIAIEVRRLWRLNAERIGTGDPDLLIVGVRLRLR
jgi:hypothetical protein